jgi:hypothetical protein
VDTVSEKDHAPTKNQLKMRHDAYLSSMPVVISLTIEKRQERGDHPAPRDRRHGVGEEGFLFPTGTLLQTKLRVADAINVDRVLRSA